MKVVGLSPYTQVLRLLTALIEPEEIEQRFDPVEAGINGHDDEIRHAGARVEIFLCCTDNGLMRATDYALLAEMVGAGGSVHRAGICPKALAMGRSMSPVPFRTWLRHQASRLRNAFDRARYRERMKMDEVKFATTFAPDNWRDSADQVAPIHPALAKATSTFERPLLLFDEVDEALVGFDADPSPTQEGKRRARRRLARQRHGAVGELRNVVFEIEAGVELACEIRSRKAPRDSLEQILDHLRQDEVRHYLVERHGGDRLGIARASRDAVEVGDELTVAAIESAPKVSPIAPAPERLEALKAHHRPKAFGTGPGEAELALVAAVRHINAAGDMVMDRLEDAAAAATARSVVLVNSAGRAEMVYAV